MTMAGEVGRLVCGLSVALMLGSSVPAGGQAGASGGGGRAKPATAASHVRYVVASTGNEARYRVREQLVGLELPNDAVGVVHDVTGAIVIDQQGKVVRDSSRIVVALKNLKSDRDRRDGYVHRRLLETAKYPTVELVPTAVRGLEAAPTTAAPRNFELAGDLTVHGVTHPTTWTGTIHAEGTDLVGSASTSFTFKDFSLTQPRVRVVLSVNDTIKLEYDFRFQRAATP